MSRLGKVLIDTLSDAKKRGLVALQASPDVVAVRKGLKLSQRQFAEIYHINPETLKKWEQHKRKPDTTSYAYLKCIEQNPEMIKRIVNS